jgi:hypothetical protein
LKPLDAPVLISIVPQMRSSTYLLAALAAVASASDVADLTKASFKEFADQPLGLVEFFAPW